MQEKDRLGPDKVTPDRVDKGPESAPVPQTDFLRETIKQKPINRKKLLRRTLITAAMAAVFGLIASLVMIILEPKISNWLYPEEPAEQIVFSEEEEEEILPEDMYADDTEMEEDNLPVNLGDQAHEPIMREDLVKALDNLTADEEDYLDMHKSLRKLAQNAEISMVTACGVTSDTDLMNGIYETQKSCTGLIMAKTAKAIIILAHGSGLENAETVEVELFDGSRATAEIMGEDEELGIVVLSVSLLHLPEKTREQIQPATLGSSNSPNLRGTPVIALGSFVGNGEPGIAYGVVTTDGTRLGFADSNYKIITTDIYGSSMASGFLINTKGSVIGIIDQTHNSEEMKNLISAYGITELKPVVEKISNEEARAYLGIHGIEVSDALQNEYGIPKGIYLNSVELDSPAMEAGIQNGDVLVEAAGMEVTSYQEFLGLLQEMSPEETLTVTVMRQNGDDYISVVCIVTLGSK